jgi:hypothetical protein
MTFVNVLTLVHSPILPNLRGKPRGMSPSDSKPVAAIVKAFPWHQTITHLQPPFRADYEWILPEVWKEFMVYEKMLAD